MTVNKKWLFCLLLCCSSCLLTQTKTRIFFQWPLTEYTITQKFHNFKKRPHLGLDLKAPLGTPILSVQKGKVIYSGHQFSGYGNIVMVEHNPHWTSLYAHLDQLKVKEGQKLDKGDIVGTVGQTGHSTGVHLHFELFYNKKNVNPLKYLP